MAMTGACVRPCHMDLSCDWQQPRSGPAAFGTTFMMVRLAGQPTLIGYWAGSHYFEKCDIAVLKPLEIKADRAC